MEEKERLALLEHLSKERSDVQSALVHQLASASSKHHRISAAFLLGLYRMEHASQDLARFIALEADPPKELHKRLPLWGQYPVVEALIRIGKPAIRHMIETIETTEDKKVRELSTKVIRYVEGPELGRVVISMAIDKQKDPKKRGRLLSALEWLQDKLPGNEPELKIIDTD